MKKKYECTVCGYVYDPEKGDESQGIPPGIEFEMLDDTYECPVCGAKKEMFQPVEENL